MTDTKVVSPDELWKDIPGYEGYYQVSNFGHVRSKDRWVIQNGKPRLYHGILMKTSLNHYGYRHVSFTFKNKGKCINVHQLVAWAFIGEQPKGIQVNHIDGNKQNNYVGNLEYVTNAQNMKHAIDIGLRTCKRRTYTCLLTDEQVVEIRKRHAAGELLSALSHEYKYPAYGLVKVVQLTRYAWVKPVES